MSAHVVTHTSTLSRLQALSYFVVRITRPLLLLLSWIHFETQNEVNELLTLATNICISCLSFERIERVVKYLKNLAIGI